MMRRVIILIICLLLCSCESNKLDRNEFFVISLDRTPERFNLVNNQMMTQGINVQKFSAIDGYMLKFRDRFGNFISWNNRLNVNDKSAGLKYDIFYNDEKIVQIPANSKMSLGEIGCACSHREIWKKVASGECNIAIVFEDDVTLESDFKNKMVSFINDLPSDWDIAFFCVGRRHNWYGSFPNVGYIFRDLDEVQGHKSIAKIQRTNLVYGTYGYIINKRGAEKLLKLTDTLYYPVDDIIFQQGGVNTGKINGYVAMERLLRPSGAESEIKKMGRSY